ncbi:MAG: hypothetical protein JO013_08055 [Alphaproteobacteria bacterium]|nr:hypothetical protein [Alphaproteobacteria bacterium]
MRRCEVERLESDRTWWVAALVAPMRDWPAAPGCRRGARFLVDARTFGPSRDAFEPFESQLACLGWIMRHRAELARALPGATVRPVPLDRWLLGLD